MVKKIIDTPIQKSATDIEDGPEEENNQNLSVSPAPVPQDPSSCGSKKKKRVRAGQSNNSSAVFENSAIGCVINFLRKLSPSPIERIVEHVRSKKLSLITSIKGKYKRSAFQIVDYALTRYPKIFPLNDRFHYYLNEEEAQKFERKFNLKAITSSKKTRQKYKEKLKQKREKAERMKRIKERIEADLNSGAREFSIMTKTYLILISGNEREAEGLKLAIRNAYLAVKNLV